MDQELVSTTNPPPSPILLPDHNEVTLSDRIIFSSSPPSHRDSTVLIDALFQIPSQSTHHGLQTSQLIKFHMSNYIMKLAQHIKVRQRVVATAITYMRRVCIRKSMVEFEPRLVVITCLYLASKAEESIVQARNLVFYIKRLYPDEYKYELKDLLGMEMKVLEALNYYLVVFHPYRSLSEVLQDAAINDVNMNQITWGIVNDTYKMDLILVHPPYHIALACIYIASVHKEKDITTWFEDLHEGMNLVKNIAMEILDFHENYRTITEEKVNSAFSKLALKP